MMTDRALRFFAILLLLVGVEGLAVYMTFTTHERSGKRKAFAVSIVVNLLLALLVAYAFVFLKRWI